MPTERRAPHPLKPKGLRTAAALNSSHQETALDADILDISDTGIRVKLKQPIAADIVGYIKITMILPESGSSFSVHGMLTHRQTAYLSGAHYANHIAGSIDDVIFLCIELDNSTVFIRTH